MQNKSSMKRQIIKVIIFAVICMGAIGLGIGTGTFKSVGNVFENIKLDFKSILKVIIMGSMVLSAAYLLSFLLNLLNPENHRTRTILSITASLIRYAAAIIVICWGLTILGADVGTVVAGVGIVALIIGFGAESLISDMVTGIFMIFENQYNVGDYVEVGGFRGKVTNIGIRTTSIEEPGGNIKIINNSDMNNILNRSDKNSKAVSVIGIPYETDIEKLESEIPTIVQNIYDRHQDIMVDVPIYLGVDLLDNSSVNLKFVVEVDDKNIFSAARVLNRELLVEFKKVGVEVPFPQVDVHQK